MMVMVVAACCPLITAESQSSNYYNEAALVAQHKVDQLRALGWNSVVNSTLLTGSGTPDVIDSTDSTSPFSFTTIDNIASVNSASTNNGQYYFPYGTTATITVKPDPNVYYCSSTLTNCDVVNITVTITWPSTGILKSNSYTLVAKLIKMVHS